ncbi:MAG TPA: hypothetical protein VGC11_09565 [Acidimicrobiia bacterium]|jgi:hypothetical protein
MNGPRDANALLELTEGELREFSHQVAKIAGDSVFDVELLRDLIRDWTTTVRVRSHPRYEGNLRSYREALASGALFEGLDPEAISQIQSAG